MTRRGFVAVVAGGAQLRGSEDLVRRIAERYGSADAYSVVASVSGSAGGVQVRQASGAVRHRFQTQRGQYRAEYSAGDPWVWVRGAEESWVYNSSAKEYRQGANASEIGAEVGAFVADLHERLGRKFGSLARIQASFEVKKSEEIKVAGVKRLCSVLSIVPRAEAWREKLWVDADGLVWKSVFDSPGDGRRPAGTRTTVWEQIEFSASIDPAVFTFVPPKGARRVERFGVRPMAEPPPLQLPNP